MTFFSDLQQAIRRGKDAERAERALQHRSKAKGLRPSVGVSRGFSAGFGDYRNNIAGNSFNARNAALGVLGIAEGGELPEAFEFVEKKAAKGFDQGYGHIRLKDPVKAMEVVRGEANPTEALRALLQTTDATIQTSAVLGGEHGAVTYDVSKNVTSSRYLERQAKSLLGFSDGGFGASHAKDFGDRVVATLDIETGGLERKSGVWQVAYQVGDGEAQEIIFDNSFLDTGVFEDAAGNRKTFTELTGKVDKKTQVEGYKKFLREIKDADTLMGQNVTFDFNYLLDEMSKLGGLDDELNDLISTVRTKMVSGDVVDTLTALKFARGELGIGDAHMGSASVLTPFSQQNIVYSTSFLEDSLRKGYLTPEQVRALKGGLHDAGVDIGVTKAIGLLARDAIRGDDKVLRQVGADEVERALVRRGIGDAGEILETIRTTSALVPSTRLPGKNYTAQDLLIQGTRKLRGEEAIPTKALQMDDIYKASMVYTPNGLVDGAAGLTRESMDHPARRGMLSPGFAEEIDYDGRVTRLDDLTGIKIAGKTTQQMLGDIGVAFAGLSEHERLISHELNRAVRGQGVRGKAANRLATGAGLSYFDAAKGLNLLDGGMGKTIVMDPAVLKHLMSEGDVSVPRVGGALATRLSTTAAGGTGDRRAVRIIDLAQDELAEQAERLQGGLRKLYLGLDEEDKVAQLAKKLGISEGRAKALLVGLLDEEGNISKGAVETALSRVGSRLKHGIQIGSVQSNEAAALIDDAVGSGRDFSEGRRYIHTLMDEGELGSEVPRTSAPLRTLGHTTEALEELEAALPEHRRAIGVAGMIEGETPGVLRGVAMDAQEAGKVGRARFGHNVAEYIAKNPQKVWRSGGLILGAVTAAALVIAGDEEPEKRHQETFDTGTYQTEEDYRNYKASMGETAMRGFVANPTSRMMNDPLATAGLPQQLHEMRTQRHNMDTANKYNYLFGR